MQGVISKSLFLIIKKFLYVNLRKIISFKQIFQIMTNRKRPQKRKIKKAKRVKKRKKPQKRKRLGQVERLSDNFSNNKGSPRKKGNEKFKKRRNAPRQP